MLFVVVVLEKTFFQDAFKRFMHTNSDVQEKRQYYHKMRMLLHLRDYYSKGFYAFDLQLT